MTRRSFLPLLAGWLMLAVAGCGTSSGDNAAVPRARAYPRPPLPDTAMQAADGVGLHFLVNRQATVSSARRDWLDADYPSLGITVHTSFTETTPEEVADVMANRMERLLLNAGSREPKFDEYDNAAGFDIIVARSDGAAIPLQFLATDHGRWVVSGAAVLRSAAAAEQTDSLRPIVDAVEADIRRALDNLH